MHSKLSYVLQADKLSLQSYFSGLNLRHETIKTIALYTMILLLTIGFVYHNQKATERNSNQPNKEQHTTDSVVNVPMYAKCEWHRVGYR